MYSQLTIQYVPINDLKGYLGNPRTMAEEDLEVLCQSIQNHGFVDPVIARRENREIIGGHQRVRAALRLGLAEVPVVFLELTADQSHLLGLSLNRISGGWDEALLGQLLAELDLNVDLDLSLSGFTDEELRRSLGRLQAAEKRDRPEVFDAVLALAETHVETRVKLGDVWQMGDHRMVCGDATDRAVVSAVLGRLNADLAVSDPPYGVDYGAATAVKHRAIKNDALDPGAWQAFVNGWVTNLLEHVDGAIYVFMSCAHWPDVSFALEAAGGHWSDTIIWAKDRFVLGRSDYQRQFEPIWYGWREGAKHYWCGDRDQGDVWSIPRPDASELHPTMKPLALIERVINNSSRAGDRVLDLFLGSGTSVIACERTGRSCYGVELDSRYCDLVLARWESFSGQAAVRE